MIYKLTNTSKSLKGKVVLSGSKSESNRALIINYLSGSPFSIDNLSNSEDTVTLQNLISKIESDAQFNVGHAGTVMRFLTTVFSITEGERILKGSGRMHERPISELVEALRALGAEVQYLEKEGYPPLKIVGKKLDGGRVKLRGDISSQYISSLMMVAPYFSKGLVIEIEGELVSRPYLEMTAQIMRHFGVEAKLETSSILISAGTYQSKPFVVESDWSSASYWYEAAAFCDDVDFEIDYLKTDDSLQADSSAKDIFTQFGIDTIKTEHGVRLVKNDSLNFHFKEYDFTNCPDIAQTLSCTSILLDFEVTLLGLKTLRIKETDRIEALRRELEKFNVSVVAGNDTLCLNASNVKQYCQPISTYEDHRMAMSFAMLTFYFGQIFIENPEVVSKSYPNFWSDLRSVGVEIDEIG